MSTKGRQKDTKRSPEVYRNLIAMSESCPHCDSGPLIRKRYLTISRIKKLKMDFGALFCCRRYCPVGMYKIEYRCRKCNWRGN
nr:uncharacterized protein LOC108076130 [Drosophila kikkawai]